MFKNRPLLAALVVLGLVGAAGAGAYAVKHVFLTVDPDKSAPEIKADLEHQLEQAGVQGEVHADKQDGLTNITVMTHDPQIGEDDVEVALPTLPGGQQAARQKIQFDTAEGVTLSDDQNSVIAGVMGSKQVAAAMMAHDQPKLVAAVRAELATRGFTDVSISATADSLTVKINAAPAN